MRVRLGLVPPSAVSAITIFPEAPTSYPSLEQVRGTHNSG